MSKLTIANNQGEKPKKSILKTKLLASEIRYRRLFESAKDGILILDAKTGMIIDVNPFLVDLLGYTKLDFTEKSIWDIGTFHDIYENRDKFLELQQNKYVRYDDLPLQTSTGKNIHVEFVSNVYLEDRHDVIQCNIRDITERTNIQHEIKFQADLINNVGQAVIATNLQGKVTYWNKAAEKIYGWSSAEAIGQNIVDLTPALQTNKQAVDIMKNLSTGKTWAGEFYVKRKDGSSFPAFVTDAPILDEKGRLTGIIGISSDITESKNAEKELIKAKEKAEESDRLKSAFLANMSHEIRTPMNGILGFAELLRTADLSGEEQQKFIDIIGKSSIRLLNIINDIISISKIESNQIELTFSDVNVNSITKDIQSFFKTESEKKKIIITFKNELPTNEAIVKTDSDMLYAILTNLVKNAIKFTQTGSIELGYKKKERFLEFYVTDSGAGVQKEQKEIIFERFRQGSESFKRNYEGAGLGLSISKAYVEMLGGKIWVENNADLLSVNGNPVNNGSTFYFTIPFDRIQQSEIVTTNHPEDNEIVNQNRNLKILIVDDDKISEMLIRILLENYAREFIHASNGIEAKELCKNNPDIDLVLMDIKMPEMDGYEATRNIRKFNKEIIIIAQTAYAIEGDREKAIAAGCNSYITKPINKVDLRNLVNYYFSETAKLKNV
ncbi:MAG: PAS domain S-box protein [Prolixibacteraceae bacterium]|nr:PAS domain S-box protein [Prolixibacteraceae bacterium]